MSMKAGQFPNTVSFPAGDSRVLRYLKGETVSLEVDEGRSEDGVWQPWRDFLLAGPKVRE